MTDRASLLHYWRVVMTAQATFWKRSNGTRNHAFTLLECAGRARREMLNQGKHVKRAVPIQTDLFAADCAAADARCYP